MKALSEGTLCDWESPGFSKVELSPCLGSGLVTCRRYYGTTVQLEVTIEEFFKSYPGRLITSLESERWE